MLDSTDHHVTRVTQISDEQRLELLRELLDGAILMVCGSGSARQSYADATRA